MTTRKMAHALDLLFRLNADRMNYTPLSHKGRRATRLIPRLQRMLAAMRTAA